MTTAFERVNRVPRAILLGAVLLVGALLLVVLAPSQARGAEPADLARVDLVLGGPDPGIPFASVSGVAIDPASGDIAIAESGRGRILFYDREGFMLGRVLHGVTTPDGTREVGRPEAIAFDRDGNLLVIDSRAPYIDVLDARGRSLDHITLPAPDDVLAAGHGPCAIAVGADGSIFVASRGDSGRVHVFDPEHQWVRSWGTTGTARGQIQGITGLAVLPGGQVVVTCGMTDLGVQIFDARGGFVRGFGVHDVGPENLSLPAGVVATSDGRIWMTDQIRQVVQVYDSTGAHVGLVGGSGSDPGSFLYPGPIASDGSKLLVVSERVGNRVQFFELQ